MSQEDCLEKIYEAIERKGYTRVNELAQRLGISPPSVTRLVQKLDDQGLVVYERYRGLTLTSEGRNLGRFLLERHTVLEEFLQILGVADPQTVYRDVEGIEHHLSPETLACIHSFVDFARSHPEWVGLLRTHLRANSPSRA